MITETYTSRAGRSASFVAAVLLCLSVVASPIKAQIPLSDTLPPLLLLHGWRSNAGTWDDAASDFTFWGFANYRWTTASGQSIGSQAQQVYDFGLSVSLNQRSPILVGHSMGGLVARHLSRGLPSDAIVTIGTPHQGHPLVANGPGALTQKALTLSSQWAVLGALSACGGYGPCYNTGPALYAAFISASAIEMVKATIMPNSSLSDMNPNGSYIPYANSLIGFSEEQVPASRKYSFNVRLYSEEEDRTLFRSFNDYGTAYYWGEYIQDISSVLQTDAIWLIAGVIFGEAPFPEAQLASAFALGSLGHDLEHLSDQWYNTIIGGWPNDGFIPIANQHYNFAINLPRVGPSHNEETTDYDFRIFVRDLGRELRRE